MSYTLLCIQQQNSSHGKNSTVRLYYHFALEMSRHVYIVNVTAISDPLFVCPNYGREELHFLCCLPYRRWGNYFGHKL